MVREGRVFISALGTGKPAFGSNYYVQALEVGAQVTVGSSGTTVTVAAGHGFAAGDKYMKSLDSATYSGVSTVASVTSTTLTLDSALSVSAGDILINLGADTGSSTPNYDGNGVTIYSDMDYTTSVTNATVTADSNGRYVYYHKSIDRWELVRTGSTLIALYLDASSGGSDHNIRYADNFGGADAGLQIAAAIADLPSTGGTVDARGLEGTQTIGTALAVGTATKKVRLILGAGTTFNITVTGGVDAITIASGSSIIGEGHGAGPILQLDAAANVRGMVAPAAVDGTQEYFYLSGVALKGNASATITACLYIRNVYVNSFVRDVVIYNFDTIGLYVFSDDSSGGTGPLTFDNIWVNGGGTTGARPVVIESSAASLYGVTFIGGALENSASGGIICEIAGGAANGNLRNVAFYNTHVEGASAGTANIGIKITDAHNIIMDGVQGIFTPDDASTAFISINETSSGYTRGVFARGIKFNTAAQTAKTLINNITGESYSGTPNLHSYSYGGASLPIRFAGADVVLTDSTGAERINLTNALGGVLGIFRNRSDAQSAIALDSGSSSAQGAGVQFRDRGTLKWRMEKSSGNNFIVRDETNSINRLNMAQANVTQINSAGSNAVQINATNSSGTGGLEIYDGAASSAKVSYCAADGSLAIKDGITAPSTAAGYAIIYVDTADGDLKVKFGDGTTKTIVVDT